MRIDNWADTAWIESFIKQSLRVLELGLRRREPRVNISQGCVAGGPVVTFTHLTASVPPYEAIVVGVRVAQEALGDDPELKIVVSANVCTEGGEVLVAEPPMVFELDEQYRNLANALRGASTLAGRICATVLEADGLLERPKENAGGPVCHLCDERLSLTCCRRCGKSVCPQHRVGRDRIVCDEGECLLETLSG